MKIGILTLPLWNNYGGILQAYALKTTLEREGYHVNLINYHHPEPSTTNRIKRKIKNTIKTTLRKPIPIYPGIKEKKHISVNTLDFIRKEFTQTEKADSTTLLTKVSKDMDAIIVGSDQVWRPSYAPNIYNFFLDFTSNKQIKASYAASFGSSNFLFTGQQAEKCKHLLHQFDAVSVREDSGVYLCKKHFNIDAKHLVDPVFLLSKQDFIKLTDSYKPKTSSGNLFTYVLDRSEEKNNFINEVASWLKLHPFECMPKTFDKNYSPDKTAYIFPPLPQWLQAFKDAKFVIADSFHGCAFALIYNIPFIALGNRERGMTRFTSLLKMFNLEERLISDIKDLDKNILNKKINWEEINLKIEKEKIKSLNFLKEVLKNEA